MDFSLPRRSRPAMESSFVDWAKLPAEFLDAILTKLFYLSDYIRFGAVCKPWRSVALDQKPRRLATMHKQPPMLLNTMRSTPNSFPNTLNHSSPLHSITEDRVYNHQFQLPTIPLRIPPNSYYYSGSLKIFMGHSSSPYLGSSHGWLIMINVRCYDSIELFNPFTQNTITIPSHPSLKNVCRVALSCNPTTHPDDFAIAAICPGRLALRRIGQDSWSFANLGNHRNLMAGIIFYREKLYVLAGRERLIAIDYENNFISGDESGVTPMVEIVPEFSSFLGPGFGLPGLYGPALVEASNGDLLLVRSFRVSKLTRVGVYKGEEKFCWVPTWELENNDSIFLAGDFFRQKFIWASSVPNSDDSNSMYATTVHRGRYHPALYQAPYGTHDTSNVELYRISYIDVRGMDGENLRVIDDHDFNVPIWITPTLC